MSNDREIVAPPQNAYAPPAVVLGGAEPDPIEQMAIDLHRFDRLRKAAVAFTDNRDWHSFGGKPWPLRSACEKLGRACKINFAININPVDGARYTKRWSEDEKGKFYLIEMSAQAWMHGYPSRIEAFGFTSSRDPFFAKTGEDADGNAVFKPATEVNEGDIIQAAYTNLVANLTMRLLGLSNVDMDELQAMLGGKEITKTEFKTGKAKTEGSPEQVDRENKNRIRLWAICRTAADDDISTAKMLLVDLSSFQGDKGKVPGFDDVNKLKGGRLYKTLMAAEERWKAFLEKSGPRKAMYEELLKEKLGEAETTAVVPAQP